MNTRLNRFRIPHLHLVAAVVTAAALAACGGGSDSSSTVVSSTTPTAPAGAAKVPTLPSGASPAVTSANCALLTAPALTPPVIEGADMQAVSDILLAVDRAHGYAEFARMPATFMWWVRGSSAVDMLALGAAVHETNHKIDSTLRNVCNTDGLARFYANDQVYVTDISRNDRLANYSIAGETYPAALKSSRSLRYDAYVTASASSSGNDLSILLDELNAYTGGANLEVRLYSSPSYAYLTTRADADIGGMVDFMLFFQSYLKAARLNYPASYAKLETQARTKAFMQFAWTRAESVLAAAYPYSTVAAASNPARVPLDVIKAVYSAPFLQELDMLGISHKNPADWAATYLK
ncbi:MAG: hypothetical protein ABIR13_00685 [Polaromonas sp.]